MSWRVIGNWWWVLGTRSSVWRAWRVSKEMLSQRHMRDQHIRHILDRPMVPALKPFAVRVRPDEPPRLAEQRLAVRRRRLVGREQLVDLHHQSREGMQPREPRVVEHQPEERTAPLDSPLLALVADAGILQERLVHAQEPPPHLLELLSLVGWEWSGAGRRRIGHVRLVRIGWRQDGISLILYSCASRA